jgi:3-methyladenine DNA glycosylase AlkD
MLREAGKRDEPRLVAFVDAHRGRMPRTMLRYAIERVPPERRAALMAPDR